MHPGMIGQNRDWLEPMSSDQVLVAPPAEPSGMKIALISIGEKQISLIMPWVFFCTIWEEENAE